MVSDGLMRSAQPMSPHESLHEPGINVQDVDAGFMQAVMDYIDGLAYINQSLR